MGAASAMLVEAYGAAQAASWPCEGEQACALFEQGCAYNESAEETRRCVPPPGWCERGGSSLAQATIPASWSAEDVYAALDEADRRCQQEPRRRWSAQLKVEGVGALLLFTEPGAQVIWLHRADERGAALIPLHTFYLQDDLGYPPPEWSLQMMRPLTSLNTSELQSFTYRLSRETMHGAFLAGEPVCCDKLTGELDVVVILEGGRPLLHASTRYLEVAQGMDGTRRDGEVYCEVDLALTADKRLEMKRTVKTRDRRGRAKVAREARTLTDAYERLDWCVEVKR